MSTHHMSAHQMSTHHMSTHHMGTLHMGTLHMGTLHMGTLHMSRFSRCTPYRRTLHPSDHDADHMATARPLSLAQLAHSCFTFTHDHARALIEEGLRDTFTMYLLVLREQNVISNGCLLKCLGLLQTLSPAAPCQIEPHMTEHPL